MRYDGTSKPRALSMDGQLRGLARPASEPEIRGSFITPIMGARTFCDFLADRRVFPYACNLNSVRTNLITRRTNLMKSAAPPREGAAARPRWPFIPRIRGERFIRHVYYGSPPHARGALESRPFTMGHPRDCGERLRTLYHRVAACPWGLSFAASNRPWAEADKMVPYRRVVSETGTATLDGAEVAHEHCVGMGGERGATMQPRDHGPSPTTRQAPTWGRATGGGPY